MELLTFTFNIGAALPHGGCTGLERQFRQHPAGLALNTLVRIGAALFVSLSQLLGERTNHTVLHGSRIVSGIGFLGGGAHSWREGLNVRGMSTAATLWCIRRPSAYCVAQACPCMRCSGAVVIVGVHLALRPVARRIDAWTKMATDVETVYQLRVGCDEQHEGLIRTILMRHVNAHAMMKIQGISSEEAKGYPGSAIVVADILSMEQQDKALQEIMNRLNIEPSVKSVSWKKGVHQPD